jgi:hypothetical protein
MKADTICSVALACISTGMIFLCWHHSTAHISNPAVMYVDEVPIPWTPIHLILGAAALLCLAVNWSLAIDSVVRLIKQRQA